MKLHFSYESPLPLWPLWRLGKEGLSEEEQVRDKTNTILEKFFLF